MRTSLYSILCILIRLGAVLMAVTTIVAIPAAWRGAEAEHIQGYGGMLLGYGGALLVLAMSLWIYPGVLARLAAGKASEQIFESPISAAELQEIAFAFVGIWFAIQALCDLVAVGAGIVVTAYESETSYGIPIAAIFHRELARIVPLAVKLALGIALAMKARGLVGWIRAFRERGLPPSSAPGGDAQSRDAG